MSDRTEQIQDVRALRASAEKYYKTSKEFGSDAAWAELEAHRALVTAFRAKFGTLRVPVDVSNAAAERVLS